MVPQMVDCSAGCSGRDHAGHGVSYAALTPNMRGVMTWRAGGERTRWRSRQQTEGFSKANLNATIIESERFIPRGGLRWDAGARLCLQCDRLPV
jgi:hydroxymethylglutaryl-CoA lyase